jgi:ribonuclease G
VSPTLLIAASPGEVWAALVEEGELQELRVLRGGARGQAGEVFLGRVVALQPDLPAALVDIGLARPAFLSAEDAVPRGLAGLEEGQAVVVQVSKEARGDKAAGVSMRVRLAGRFLDFLPTRPGLDAEKALAAAERERLLAALREIAAPGEGLALRADASGAARDALAADADALRARWRAIEAARAQRRPPAPLESAAAALALVLAEFAPSSPEAIIIDDRAAFAASRLWLHRHRPRLADRLALHRDSVPLFEHHGIAGAVAAALAPRVALAEGGALTIETTAAATMIDVDTGSAAGRGKAESAALATNLAAAREAARQIRLRNLAGPIVVDFVGMRDPRHRERVRDALQKALDGDADTRALGWTRLGHFELVRKRRRAPLAELLFERAPGGGLVKTALTVTLEALRAAARQAEATPAPAPTLFVHPEVAAALAGEARAALAELETRLGRSIAIVSEPGRPRERFDIRLG